MVSIADPSKFHVAHIRAVEETNDTPELSLDGDLLLLTSSWEKRCLEITRARHGRYNRGAMIGFAELGESELRPEHDEALQAFLAKQTDSQTVFEPMASSDLQGWRDAIREFLVDGARAAGRPIDLLVDLTCLPKYFALLVLGFALKAGVARRITFFYAGGRYDLTARDNLSPVQSFTEGDWRSFQVPYLEGDLSADRKVRIVAAIGFETYQARSFIEAYEAESHELIMPYPGFSPDYEPRGENETKALATFLDIDMDRVHRVPAGSAVQSAELALNLYSKGKPYRDLALCLGTKPQALGLGLAALCLPHVTVVCRIPSRYAETSTPPSGRSWVYRVEDTSALPLLFLEPQII